MHSCKQKLIRRDSLCQALRNIQRRIIHQSTTWEFTEEQNVPQQEHLVPNAVVDRDSHFSQNFYNEDFRRSTIPPCHAI